jgi:tRNA/tmRNA/rRNA uracil-C5-methylase (TrmA/RlmC/RlmD family)
MPEVGEKLELAIEDLAYRGSGIARHDGLVVFVNRVAPGERVEARITHIRKNFAEAVPLRVLEASPHRIPPCTQMADGRSLPGCVYDFLDYGAEVETKHRQMLGLLRRSPGIDAAARPPFASPRPLNYRNKIVLHAQRAGRDLATIGYYGEDKRTVVDIERCPLAQDAINFAWSAQRTEARRKLENGQSLTLRWTPADGVKSWIDQAPEDAPMLTEASPAGPLSVPLDGFYQVNGEVADALVLQVREWVMQAAAESGTKRLLDLYCGVGVFAIDCAAAGAGPVLGIESVRGAVAAARMNGRARAAAATFRCARVEDAARTGFGDLELARMLVVVDPPRQGLEPNVVTTLGNGRVPHLVYVACDPATLARDIKRFEPFGYQIRAARMFDMFPRTMHFETAVWLSLDAP